MSTPVSTFLIYALIAVFAENAIFSRSLAVERTLLLVDDQKSLLSFGVLTTICILPAALATYFAAKLVPQDWYLYAFRPILFVGCMVAIYLIMRVILTQINVPFVKKLWLKVRYDLHLSMFNSAVFGSLLLCNSHEYTLLQTMGFCLGSGIGFTIATLYVAEGQRKLRNRNVPAAFKGLPVTLLYIGILSLCIYAFTGYQLAN